MTALRTCTANTSVRATCPLCLRIDVGSTLMAHGQVRVTMCSPHGTHPRLMSMVRIVRHWAESLRLVASVRAWSRDEYGIFHRVGERYSSGTRLKIKQRLMRWSDVSGVCRSRAARGSSQIEQAHGRMQVSACPLYGSLSVVSRSHQQGQLPPPVDMLYISVIQNLCTTCQ